MIKIEDIKAKQEEMDKIQKELQGMIESYEKQEREQNVFELKYPDIRRGDKVYFLANDGRVYIEPFYKDLESDRNRVSQGNVFETKEQAFLEQKRRNLLTRFRQFRDRCNDGWTPDFEDVDTEKYYICYEHKNKCLNVFCGFSTQFLYLFGYFKNRKDAQRAIELFGDEIKELFVDMKV